MKIYTEFIVIHEDEPMPNEDNFCPSFWQSEDFDSDGDYYYENIEGRWTNLELTKRIADDKNSILKVNTFREKRIYEPGIQEVADLQRYIDYKKDGRYANNPVISSIKSLAITSLTIETFDLQDYREFLKTVYFFLEYTKGFIVNIWELDAASFQVEFLSD
ncbi:hypothetical protein NIES2100_44990 [Calothrix sp. NIES-2100]|uniref:hypothetical protein n=1 Tax=Calothrix sp. NIES-2100 TaxID=1954172 RepID=UPI000B5EAB4E|nr:hypothetical protein NIES2100_44990 [Calothrix sp. NIES-2100]